MRRARGLVRLLPLLPAVALSGCQMVVMDPKGPIGLEEKNIILLATALMLLVVIPVIAMTILFAWRYRASNREATYAPDWEHSGRIEAVVWAIPCLIILALGTVTWVSTHKLDPRAAIASKTPNVKPVEVQVVSLDWKWLFIYPDYGVASVNELALPVGTPVHFRMTSASVMNSFFVPQLGSQIYTMTGMETQLSLRADAKGTYDGISANYSGEGFAGMKFNALAMSPRDFNAWIAKAHASPNELAPDSYAALSRPSEKTPVSYYGTVDPTLYTKILNKCANGGTCTDTATYMAMIKSMPDAKACKPGTRREG
jgi:cytochrome o ubiquinol oxidase subunit 2